MSDTRLFGIRHHGPGSSRALTAELVAFRPDVVLIEGPPEADALVPMAADPALEPPVALLAYVVDDVSRAAFWPFAVFSPEWQAIRHAVDAGVPVRFCDLPAANQFALDGRPGGSGDPLARLAAIAGYDDPERWWDDMIEHRREPAFDVIADAMAALRADEPVGDHDARREAYMRTVLRRTIRARRLPLPAHPASSDSR